ncbi:MAG: GNAT family N-acetyltransferase [Bacteroidales bacterium]|nr:GNAT family N-acetyltransferase [Bacteroidales bacterium]MBO7480392.1 GNAT family N-acetyltransferase [Bacteroidales bacterium]MBO7488470.1 GNAT family N-acetyltransferase [Bacteroidales bacterium]
MKKIIDPVPVELIKAELTKSKKLEDTNKGHNELYIVTWQDSPNVVTEIGRLREIAFREAGGSTGEAIDLDEYDKMEKPYKQLIVWDPDNEAIIGGYRFLFGADAAFDENGQPMLASSHQFRFSQKFIDEYLPYTIELGRNFVAPEYQSSKLGSKSIFAMDNLWDGLIAIIMKSKNLLYYFGKITVYPSYDYISRDLIYHFLWKHFGDKEELVRPWDDQALMPKSDPGLMDLVLNKEDLIEDYKLLRSAVRMRGVNIPPNVSAYVSSTSQMMMFGTAVNRLMHNIEDTGILIPFDGIYHEKRRRHIGAYLRWRRSKRHKDKDLVLDEPEIENQMVEHWLTMRNRKVKRLLKNAGRKE